MEPQDRRMYILAAAIVIAAIVSSLILSSAISSGAKTICLGFEQGSRVTNCP